MPEVTCPRCHTRQPVDGDTGYTCASCGAAWMFAACDHCGSRFHMRPGTTVWTCPACGHEHGAATMSDLSPQPEVAPPSEPPRVPEPEAHVERRATMPPRHASAPRSPRPPTRGRLAVIAIAGIAGVVAVAFVLSSLGAGGEATATSTTSAAVTSSAPVSPVDALCLHLRDLQTPREDSLTRLATTLQSDAAAIQGEGKAKLAAAVDTMRRAVLAYRDALAAQGDTTQAGVKIANALDGLPC